MGINPFVIDDGESRELTEVLLARVDSGDARYSVHVVESLDVTAALGLEVTARVFGSAFGNSADLLWREYANYLPSMLHVIVCDVDAQRPVGSIGLVRTPAPLLKTIVDIQNEPWNVPADSSLALMGLHEPNAKVWDIATFAVLPEVRRSRVAIALLHAGYLASMRAGVHAWTAILDDVVLRGVDALTRGAFLPIPGTVSRPYLGSVGSTPTYALVPYDVDLTSSSSWVTGRGLERTYSFADGAVASAALV